MASVKFCPWEENLFLAKLRMIFTSIPQMMISILRQTDLGEVEGEVPVSIKT